MAAVEFRQVDIVFGTQTKAALAMVDSGATRDEILSKTGCVLGRRASTSASSGGRSTS